jgi:hypothetical protein
MDLHLAQLQALTRRHFFGRAATGIGGVALAALANEQLLAAPATPASSLAVKPTHFAPKAKRVIYMHMAGSPSQLDLFDDKPKLRELTGQPCPDSLLKKERFAFIKGVPKMLGSPYTFAKHGQSGAEVTPLLPHFSKIVDDVAIVKSMVTEQFNHAPAQLFLNTGSAQLGRPSMGSWLTYGLGSENQNLPGFVVLISSPQGPDAGTSLWGNAFLPGEYQGVQFRSSGDPVLYVSNPPGMDSAQRRRTLDALRDLNKLQVDALGDPETLTRIEQYELSYRMQTAVPELMDLSGETKETLDLYGAKPGERSFSNNCLLARRLIERGTRFVQLYHWGWDSHGTNKGDDIMSSLPERCKQCDQGAAALVTDLKRLGLLDDTLIVWGGEFGRTPMNEERGGSKFLGRDHHPHAFTIWMAGGGIKPGITYGATDDLGYHVAENKVHVHDLQATILYCLGLDHTKLTYSFQGREFRLTDVFGDVVKGLLA